MRTEQQRNLLILKVAAGLALAGLVAVLIVLYNGNELPYYELSYQHTDAMGYAPPPRLQSTIGQSVPRRVGVPPTHPVVVGPAFPSPLAGGGWPAGAGLTNPLAGQPGAVAEGRSLFRINCAMCHGAEGQGDGPVGQSYTPAPPSLRAGAPSQSPAATYVVITTGIRSTPVPTAAEYLPVEWHSFRDILTERQRWAIATFVATGWGGSNAASGR